ncbi:MAG: LmeA family phospholipid-binding protein [Actinomycetota bacterium]
MRKLLFTVVTVLALLLAAEVGVTLLSQQGMERALRSQYELPDSLEASINSFPFLVSLARNHIGELQLTWEGELGYQAGEGALAGLPYRGSVNLYDLELNMPALLTGRLEVREVSRHRASMAISISDIGKAMGLPGDALEAEGGRLYLSEGGKKTQCVVKASGVNGVAIEPLEDYMNSKDSGHNPDDTVHTVVFPSLPVDAELLNARVEGSMVILEMSIPQWEGYL